MLQLRPRLSGTRVPQTFLMKPAKMSLHAQVAKGIPTAVTIASKDDEVASRVQDLLSTHRFRCYRTTDVQGERAHKAEAPHSYA